MDWQNPTKADNGSLWIPDSWLHLYYYESLNILFRFENALRLFTYIVLKKELKDQWDNASIGDSSTIRKEAKKRIAQAREHGYLGYEVSSPMLFLNSGELTQIITSDAYWKYFAPHFKATKSIIQNKLNEIGTVRNSLAHFRPIRSEDLDLVKQNSRHILLGVEACLQQAIFQTSAVPTNSTKNWYSILNSLSNECMSVSVFQSSDRNWIRVQISYKVPTLERNMFDGNYISFAVGSTRTGNIIAKFPSISRNCVYVAEQPVFGRIDESRNLVCEKHTNIIFHESVLDKCIDEISSEISQIIATSQAETEQIIVDRLALGELVETKILNVSYREDTSHPHWAGNYNVLNTAISEAECVEYWGPRAIYNQEVITQTHHYPWMPSTVSKESWPF